MIGFRPNNSDPEAGKEQSNEKQEDDLLVFESDPSGDWAVELTAIQDAHRGYDRAHRLFGA